MYMYISLYLYASLSLSMFFFSSVSLYLHRSINFLSLYLLTVDGMVLVQFPSPSMSSRFLCLMRVPHHHFQRASWLAQPSLSLASSYTPSLRHHSLKPALFSSPPLACLSGGRFMPKSVSGGQVPLSLSPLGFLSSRSSSRPLVQKLTRSYLSDE